MATVCAAMDGHTSLTPAARALGYAGLLPQIICIVLIVIGHDWRYSALAGGFAYAAAIFSFLGGVWWGQALASGRAGAGAYIVAVLPSLIALALFLPWTFGWEWPGPALYYLGALIMGSPVIDRALGFASADFLRLRWHLSLGLGLLTMALGLLSGQVI
jgi:F0F1-type ATP synthase assembly protein I